jgi:pimeloyl-ACP methyl ester carboxylesterase
MLTDRRLLARRGASGLRDLLLGALGVESATLVGQSRGGGGAVQLA